MAGYLLKMLKDLGSSQSTIKIGRGGEGEEEEGLNKRQHSLTFLKHFVISS